MILPAAPAGVSMPTPATAEPLLHHPRAAVVPNDFDALVDHYQRPLLRFLYGVVHDHEQALDLCQDTLLSAYRALPRIQRDTPLDAWLYTIALNHARVALRRRKLLQWVPFLQRAHDRAAPETDFTSDIIGRDSLREMLRQLPLDQRAALLLHAEGFRYAEIAQVLGCSAEQSSCAFSARAATARRCCKCKRRKKHERAGAVCRYRAGALRVR